VKIPIPLEITPNLKIATFYRPCACCNNDIGPFNRYEVHELADISFSSTCASHFASKSNKPAD
jgi:hypothetical protein